MPIQQTITNGGVVKSWASLADSGTLDQAVKTAQVAAVHGHVALMPDAHLGKGATIGSVIPTRTAIIPAAVGVDIGCGVTAARIIREGNEFEPVVVLSESDLPDDLNPLIGEWEQRIPAGLGRWADGAHPGWERFVAEHGLPTLWEEEGRIKGKAPLQLGSLGSGNHFLELCVDGDGDVWLMLHSGSRGTGNMLAQHHIRVARGMVPDGTDLPDPDLAALQQDTPEFDAYIHDLMWSQNYARVNRDHMMWTALRSLEATLDRSLAFDPRWRVNNHHNYAARETFDGQELWITRKGAINAEPGRLGVIPGSMGTGSYVVRGLGNREAWNSASHGAGRAMSRTKARKTFTEQDMAEAMKGRVWQKAHARALLDEIPGAYHDLDVVMADQVDLVEPVFHLRTVCNYKGTESGRW